MMIIVWRVIHILFAAVWFGSGLTIASDAKAALAARENGGELLMEKATKAFQRSFAGLILTFGSGFGLIFAMGGFKVVHKNVHMVMALTLLAVLLRAALAAPALARVRKGVSGSEEDAAEADAAKRKLAMALGIEHLLFLVGLAMMVYAANFAFANQ